MRSVRCDVCGTKALMAASKCPKCSHPLAVRDGFGDLLPLAHCPTCDSDYPLSSGACKWCGTPPEKASIGPYVWKGVGVAAFLSLGIGAFLIRDHEPAAKPTLLLPATDSTAVVVAADSMIDPRTILQASPTDSGVVMSEVVSTGVVSTDSAMTAVAMSDTASVGVADATPTDTAARTTESVPGADSATTATDFAPVPVDNAREPWLPPPSVIRRAPPPPTEPTRETASRDASTRATSSDNPPTVASGGTTSAPPASARAAAPSTAGSDPTRVADADGPSENPPRADVPARSSASRPEPARAVASRPASARATSSRPTPPAAKSPPPRKSVAKSTPNRGTPRTATTARNARGKTVTPAPRTPTKVAKAPAPRPRTSARWTSSVARQWAVVRADANSRGRIIGSVGPDTRVQLGESRNGFRRIRAKGLAGWVHGRAVFVAAPPPRRSGRLATQ